jgi:hypothetical protein
MLMKKPPLPMHAAPDSYGKPYDQVWNYDPILLEVLSPSGC